LCRTSDFYDENLADVPHATRSSREILEGSPEEEEEVNVGRGRRSPLCSGALDDNAAADDNAAPGAGCILNT